MCNRARLRAEPETLFKRFGVRWLTKKPRNKRFDPVELFPRGRAYVVREIAQRRGIDVMRWDVLGGSGPWAMAGVRNLALPHWKRLAEIPGQRCLIPLTEFCECTPESHVVGAGKPIKGEMWFAVTKHPVFAVAGFWRQFDDHSGFAMVMCDPNELIAPTHQKSMITILEEADWDRWLTCSFAEIIALQRPYSAGKMTMRGPVFPTGRETKS